MDEQWTQMDIYDFMSFLNGEERKEIVIDKPIRLIELFAGYGSQAMALRNLGADFEHYKISEWCIPSVNMYHAVHCADKYTPCKYEKDVAVSLLLKLGVSMDGKQPLTEEKLKRKSVEWLNDVIAKFLATNNLGSICNFNGIDLQIEDTDHFTYLLTYSFPCQDLSVAGKGRGMTKGSDTRSGLLWEVERLLSETENLPQILLMENVPQVHSKANMEDFQKWLDFLESKGYTSFYQDLNARNYGVAQNRNRCFCVSILGKAKYIFPNPIELTKVLKDYLEDTVDKKYYITSDRARELIDKLILSGKIPNNHIETSEEMEVEHLGNLHPDEKFQSGEVVGINGLAPTICAGTHGYCNANMAEVKRLGNLYGEEKGTGFAGNVWDSKGLSPTLTTMMGGEIENL